MEKGSDSFLSGGDRSGAKSLRLPLWSNSLGIKEHLSESSADAFFPLSPSSASGEKEGEKKAMMGTLVLARLADQKNPLAFLKECVY